MSHPRSEVTEPKLDLRFSGNSYDPLLPTSLLQDEVAQRRESGYDVDASVEAANRLDTDDREGILSIVDGMQGAARGTMP